MKLTTSLLILVGFLAVSSLMNCDCNSYNETGPGQVSTFSKSASWRSEGGGTSDSSLLAGTHKVAGAFIDVQQATITYTPQKITISTSVVMTQMKNQEFKFAVTYYVMPLPSRFHHFWAEAASWKPKIATSGKTVLQRELGKLKLGLASNNAPDSLTMDDRNRIAKRIVEETRKEFAKNNPDLAADFYIAAMTIESVEFPQVLLEAYTNYAAESYKKELMLIQQKVTGLNLKIQELTNMHDMEAYSLEAAQISSAFVQLEAVDMLDKAAQSPNTKFVVIIEYDEQGNLTFLTGPGNPGKN